jgi:hypothetical protein
MDHKFWKNVDKTSDPQGCWLWTGYIRPDGYGFTRIDGKKTLTHRASYLLSGLTIPDDLHLCHSNFCVGKKNCCNPDHLTPQTQSQNMMDMHRDGTVSRPRRKLTDAQVLEIRASVGKTHRQLAKDYGVGKGSITGILNRVYYKYI